MGSSPSCMVQYVPKSNMTQKNFGPFWNTKNRLVCGRSKKNGNVQYDPIFYRFFLFQNVPNAFERAILRAKSHFITHSCRPAGVVQSIRRQDGWRDARLSAGFAAKKWRKTGCCQNYADACPFRWFACVLPNLYLISYCLCEMRAEIVPVPAFLLKSFVLFDFLLNLMLQWCYGRSCCRTLFGSSYSLLTHSCLIAPCNWCQICWFGNNCSLFDNLAVPYAPDGPTWESDSVFILVFQ